MNIKCSEINDLPFTSNQIWVIEELQRQGCWMIANATNREWHCGRPYYIDSRVPVRGVRRKFDKGNREAEATLAVALVGGDVNAHVYGPGGVEKRYVIEDYQA